ncbi:Leucine--tRNA ligase [uncultured archaeon]|nr:Leucine--tRNA ligase [uncultured archaeon]
MTIPKLKNAEHFEASGYNSHIPKLTDIKNWSVDIEKQITEEWKNNERFRFDPQKTRKIYSIDTPPPYVNAPIHIGHAVSYCYMDFFARYKRMKGYDVLFPLGLDRNGLPIEVGAEKKYNISPFSVSREEFLRYCKKLLEESSVESADSFAKLGISFTSYKEGGHIGAVYKTDSPEYRELTQSTFTQLYKKGLIYEDSRISNWDQKLRTTVADSEIERKEAETKLNYVKFRIKGSKEKIIIATTRPELLCTSVLIIYNPKDERYTQLKNKIAITPIFNSEVKIIPHEDADPNFGTGLVFMSSSGGDQDAVRFLRKMGIKPASAVGIDGRMNENAGLLKGMKTKESRE